MKRNGYFTFQMIIDITGVCGTISFFRYAWIAEVLYKQFLIQKLYNGLNIADNGYFAFQTIIDIAGMRGTISDAVCVGS